MSQNRKRPVTYGKSPLNRSEAYASGPGPGLRATTSPLSLDQSVRATCASPKSSARLPQSACPPKIALGSPSSHGGDERNSMQQKRRKVSHQDVTSRGFTPVQRKSHTAQTGTSEGATGHDKAVLSSITHDEDQECNHSLQSPSSESFPESEATPQSSRFEQSLASTSMKGDMLSTRRRLIDSLATADDDIGSRISASDDKVDSNPIFNDTIIKESSPSPTHGYYTQDQPKNRTRRFGRISRDPSAPMTSILRSSGVTYSRQRSFLDDSLSLSGNEPHGFGKYHELGTGSASSSVGLSRMPSEEESLQESKPVRSIHELRRAGDNARFREVVDSMFEDLENHGTSRSGICCGFAELCGKLVDPQFAHRFSEQGFDERLVDCTPSSLDIPTAFLALTAYKLILSRGHASRQFPESSWTKILQLCPSLLDVEDNILALVRKPSTGLSKTAKASITTVCVHLPSVTGSISSCLSPRLLALECMKSILVVFRENGHTVRSIPIPLLQQLTNMMTMMASNDLDGAPSEDTTQLLDLAFAVFESYSLVTGGFDHGHIQCFKRLSRLHGLLIWGQHDNSKRKLALSYVRVILNLTNKDPALCAELANSTLVSDLVKVVIRDSHGTSKDFCDDESSVLDGVILALGTLINLTEKAEQARTVLLQSDGHTVSLLDQLLGLFSIRVRSLDQARSVSEVHDNVMAGYLSILLLTVCLDNKARLTVKNSASGDSLDLILLTAEKFLLYHKTVEKEIQSIEMLEQEEHRLTARLEHVISQIRLLEEFSNEP